MTGNDEPEGLSYSDGVPTLSAWAADQACLAEADRDRAEERFDRLAGDRELATALQAGGYRTYSPGRCPLSGPFRARHGDSRFDQYRRVLRRVLDVRRKNRNMISENGTPAVSQQFRVSRLSQTRTQITIRGHGGGYGCVSSESNSKGFEVSTV